MFTFAELFFFRSVKDFLEQAVYVLYGCEEHSKVVRRLDQRSDHADDSSLAMKWMLLSPSLFRGHFARILSRPRLVGVQILGKLQKYTAHCGPSFFSSFSVSYSF